MSEELFDLFSEEDEALETKYTRFNDKRTFEDKTSYTFIMGGGNFQKHFSDAQYFKSDMPNMRKFDITKVNLGTLFLKDNEGRFQAFTWWYTQTPDDPANVLGFTNPDQTIAKDKYPHMKYGLPKQPSVEYRVPLCEVRYDGTNYVETGNWYIVSMTRAQIDALAAESKKNYDLPTVKDGGLYGKIIMVSINRSAEPAKKYTFTVTQDSAKDKMSEEGWAKVEARIKEERNRIITDINKMVTYNNGRKLNDPNAVWAAMLDFVSSHRPGATKESIFKEFGVASETPKLGEKLGSLNDFDNPFN